MDPLIPRCGKMMLPCRARHVRAVALGVLLSTVCLLSPQLALSQTEKLLPGQGTPGQIAEGTAPAAEFQPLQSGQENSRKSRPRIALVLEGGGALGFAHIGVISYLEQHHIPVDLVVGTSMGGLVGGLYASGRSPNEIRELVKSIDWDATISGKTPFEDLSYRRKEDRIAYPNRLEFGVRHGVSAPEGLSSGQQVGLILDRATLSEYDLRNFDDLPIAFRCVATNMTTGRAEVFTSGPLTEALRATMSIPGIFPPVKIGANTFTDGGAVDNLPVDVAKANHADIVIASYLDAGQATTQKDASFLSAAGATISIMIAANELQSIEQADVLIRSDLKGYTSMMFTDSAAIIPKGFEGAARKESMLNQLSVGDAEWSRYVAERSARRKSEVPVPQFLEVKGADSRTEKVIHSRLDKAVLGQPVNPDLLDQSMTRFVGLGTWNAAGYSMTERDGTPGLQMTAYPKSYGPPFLNLGITIDGADLEDVLFGMSGRLTFNNLGGYRAEWRNRRLLWLQLRRPD